ncbi:NADPH-dependent FMN reductase [anaerobic digester metagenome]
MKITVFNGSPAGINSSTNVIAEAFLNGAKKAGAEVENIFLTEKNINHCKGCFACWFKTPGTCIIDDDMNELMQKYTYSDIVVLATPVYTWNMTAMLKNFVDRLIPLKQPLITETKGRFDLEETKPKTQKFVIISNCGFPGNKNFDILQFSVSPCKPALEIYRNCGKLLKSRIENVQVIVRKYLQVVEQAGYEMATQGEIHEETKDNLNMELMSTVDYVKHLGM